MGKLVILLLMVLLCACSNKETNSYKTGELDGDTDYYCLVIGSYHEGYEGQDKLYEGIESELEGFMTYSLLSMDTKNNPETSYIEEKTLEILENIELIQPDIIIAMDDNASKYVVEPFLKDGEIPVLFVGVNWSADKYGYPYSNATGMIEVHPIRQGVDLLFDELETITTATCIIPATESDQKHADVFMEIMEEYGIEVTEYKVNDYQEFQEAFIMCQDSDLIYFTNYVGIKEWNETEAMDWTLDNTKVLTFSTNPWVNDYVCVGINMDSFEQGQYVGALAKAIIIDQMSIGDYPIISNRLYSVTLNEGMVKGTGISFSKDFIVNAIKIKDTKNTINEEDPN